MRIIFVGLHNKPHKRPLDGSTKTGKLINRIIEKLDTTIEIVKTNLFDSDTLPISKEFYEHREIWYWKYLPVEDDIIILLGAMTHNEFKYNVGMQIKVAHPASKRSHKDMNEYVIKTVDKINKSINEL